MYKRIVCFFVLIFSFLYSCKKNISYPIAKKGVIDISFWKLQEKKIELDGEWDFYPGALIPPEEIEKYSSTKKTIYVPGVWEKGVSSTLHLKIKGVPDSKNLGIKISNIATSFELFINGKKIANNGKPSLLPKDYIPDYIPLVADFHFQATSELDVVLHISNFDERDTGILKSISFGYESELRSIRERQIAFELFLFGSLLIIGLYHLGLFVLRTKDQSPLFFGIVCILIGLRSILEGERFFYYLFPEISWEIKVKLNYISFYAAIALFLNFIYTLYPQDFSLKFAKFVSYTLLPLNILILVTPVAIFCQTVIPVQVIAFCVVMYILYTTIKILIYKRPLAKIYVVGILVMAFGVINDLLYHNRIIETLDMGAFGLFFFIFSQSFLLSIRFSRAFSSVELLSEALQETNLAYSKFVPKEFLKFLERNQIYDVKLGDNVQKEMSILFSDIRSFTEISESLTPESTFHFLNSYLSYVSPVIRKNHGFIDKYIGDAIMALFPETPDQALNAGIQLMRELNRYNVNRTAEGLEPINIGIGIHKGSMILGTIGEQERMESTVISDAVNLASRLEGLNKVYGSNILVSEYFINSLSKPSNFFFRKLEEVLVKGKKKLVTVYEVYNGYPDKVVELIQSYKYDFEEAIKYYSEQNYERAIAIFTNILKLNPNDKVAIYFLNQSISYFRLSQTDDGKTIQEGLKNQILF